MIETPTASGDKAGWLAQRKTGIGGSDAAVVAGFSPWKTPFQLWEEKTGRREDADLSDNEAVEWGLRLEDVVADAYAERTGRKVRRVHTLQRHRLFDHVVGNFDRLVVGEQRGLECKTTSEFSKRDPSWGEDGSDQVPDPYFMQVQHYLAITGFKVWDLAALFGGRHLRVYTIPRHEQVIARLLILETEFWKLVRMNEPPTASTMEEALEKYPASQRLSLEATHEIAALVEMLRALKADEKANAGKIDSIKTQIAEFLGEHDLLSHRGKNLLTWRETATTSMDSKRLNAEKPDVYEAYVRHGKTRTMRLATASTK